MGKTLVPVDGYIRVSRVGGRNGDSFISPELQRESINRVCKREGLKVVKWFEELDASGGDSKRPKWNQAIERVEQGKTKGLVCWNLSRFSRSTVDALKAIQRIEEAGGRLYSEEGATTKLDRGLRLLIAEDERDRARAGFRAATERAIARGVYISAKIPFGYGRDPQTKKLVPDERAPIVVALFEQRAKGRSWRQLSTWLAEEHGLYLSKTTISGMLSNPAYLGHARQGEIINPRAHKRIVSQLLWDQAQAAKGKRPIHNGSTSSRVLLRGLVKCSTCGHTLLIGNTRSAADESGQRLKVPCYQCRYEFCDNKAGIRADRLDEWIVSLVLDWLSDDKLRTGSDNTAELAQAEKEHDEASHQLSVFKANRKAITTLGVEAWNELLSEYVLAEALARETVDALSAQDSILEWEQVPDLWDEWTDESRREFLAKVVREVVLAPANRKQLPAHERVTKIELLDVTSFAPEGARLMAMSEEEFEAWEREDRTVEEA